ncbi:MAG: hypothetical protein WC205_16490 [Opitutaceae bacterium]
MNSRLAFFVFGLACSPSLLSALTFSDWQTASFTSAQLVDSAISGATADGMIRRPR